MFCLIIIMSFNNNQKSFSKTNALGNRGGLLFCFSVFRTCIRWQYNKDSITLEVKLKSSDRDLKVQSQLRIWSP